MRNGKLFGIIVALAATASACGGGGGDALGPGGETRTANIASAVCTPFETHPSYKVGNIVASGTATGPAGSIFQFIVTNGGQSTVSTDCGTWTKTGTITNNVRCTAPVGGGDLNWSVTQEVFWCLQTCDNTVVFNNSDLHDKYIKAQITDANAANAVKHEITVTCS
jgi:hypothetical protein